MVDGNIEIPVSVIVMTKNEEQNISECLGRLKGFSEIFVVDSLSSDATRSIASDHGARVIDFKWNGKYPKKKQWCLDNLDFANDWILFVDADEHMYESLAREIHEVVTNPFGSAAGYFVRFDSYFMGKVLRHGHYNLKLVLMKRGRARFIDIDDLYIASMWEVEGHYQPVINGPVAKLKGRMLHRDFKSLYSYFERHNKYSDWEAVLRSKGLLASPEEAQLPGRRMLKNVFDALPLKHLAIFFFNYIWRLGFLDGAAGFNYAVSRSVYYWQIQMKQVERTMGVE